MARVTKKDIYKKYNIEFKDGKIMSPEFGLVSPLCIDGNAKLGKGVWTWSTLPTNKPYTLEINGKAYTENGTCPCHCNGCYATTGFYCMTSTQISMLKKTYLARHFPDWTKNAIIAQIKADNIKLFRIHASGDFDSDAYIAMWKDIITACPECVFWTYTKNSKAENAFSGLKNINVVKSVIHGFGFNFGKCGYILKVYRALKDMGKDVYICRCGIDNNQHCTNCKGCSKNEYVLFVEHSTDYVKENDLDYAELIAIVEAQQAQ